MRRLLPLLLLALVGFLAALPAAAHAQAKREYAILASGCFWCTEADLEGVPGVLDVVSGYTGGREPNPTYEDVVGHRTGHREAVRVVYDPARITYDQLLRRFWPTLDPTDAEGQFCDRGRNYAAAIFVRNRAQRRAAALTKAEVERRLGRKVVTDILPETPFWPAEAYHQDYAEKNPLRYKTYRQGCGRDRTLRAVWGR